MTTRIDTLTAAQEARMAPFAQEWITWATRTGPLTETEWAAWEHAARQCYAFAGVPWPGVVVRVPSPLVGALASPIASHILQSRVAVHGAVAGAVDGAVDGAVHGAVRDAVDGAVGGAVAGAVGVAVGVAVGGAVDGAVDGAVHGAVRDAVHDAVAGAVAGAVDGAVGVAVAGAVDGAVGVAVAVAVDDAVGDGWYRSFGGRHYTGWWTQRTGFFRDETALELPGDLWDRSRAFQAAQSAGRWWPTAKFVMVVDLPVVLHRERVGPDGWGSHRLHCEDGPAIAWADGWGIYAWHGTQVPADLIEVGWDTTRILQESNAEVRRCAIERMGWDRFVVEAGLARVGEECADPGNPGQTLALFDVPEQIYDEPVRVLLCTNGTPEADGSRHQFGLTVPAEIQDPVAAAAWTFGTTATVYRQLERAT